MTMTTLKQNLILLCLLLSCSCSFFRPAHPFVFQRIAGPQHRHRCPRKIGSFSNGIVLQAQSDPEDDEKEDPVEEFLAMEEASQRVNRRLMMPRMIMSSIGSSIQFLAWGFVIFSFFLNVAGYAIINDDNSIRIGTLEDRDFQMEIVKSMKEK